MDQNKTLKQMLLDPIKIFAAAVAVTIGVLSVIFKIHPLLALPLFVSVVISFLQSKVNRYCFLIGAINAIFYAAAYYIMTLYSTAAYALLISFPLQAVTFITWNKKTSGGETQTRKMSARTRILLAISMIAAWVILYLVFHSLGSDYLIFDNTITVIGIVGTIIAAMRFAEYAFIKVASDCINIALYITMMITDHTNVIWLIFTVYSATCAMIAFIKMNKAKKETSV